MTLLVNEIIYGAMPGATKIFPDGYFDAIITDPPYELGFMGKSWDNSGVAYNINVWREVLRIAKPGAIMLCFGGTRTFHRLTCAIEDAGWQIRDCFSWLYGSGFPKSLNISKAIDKAKGVYKKGEVLPSSRKTHGNMDFQMKEKTAANPQTDLAKLWCGYGTALKPAWEPIIVAMKPLDGTYAQNAEKHGVAGLNIDGGRIGKSADDRTEYGVNGIERKTGNVFGKQYGKIQFDGSQGRWPANVILDEEAAAMLDEQSGISRGGKTYNYVGQKEYQVAGFIPNNKPNSPSNRGDSGGASRFFYCAKASRSERNAGLEGMDAEPIKGRDTGQDIRNVPYKQRISPIQNHHPTVKPLKLMEYLCRLVKPPSEHPILLDPFCGSGTTLMAAVNTGWDYVGVEKEAEYVEIARRRVMWAKKQRQGQIGLFDQ
ncbi:hypothetical protein LCGC14_1644600 [marine sediment metagenome]|uniref:DNA methylase N-4/N-6 domain-containing protein n=1 Tax=marine sediment metagenome TaxID=412755 RepID=A0A0F9KYI5_9ZZZZ